jgi:hypothetical protein
MQSAAIDERLQAGQHGSTGGNRCGLGPES